ncbi:MAG: hypothetical protein ABH843_03380 [Candidatus Omnitrophota bacterium]
MSWTGNRLRELLKNYILHGIVPSEAIFISGAIEFEPHAIVLTEYFLRNQNEFWLLGSIIGIFDESFSWIIEVIDDGQTLLATKNNI